ncbi:hypothetical protein D3C75_1305280 [compost metagenome]
MAVDLIRAVDVNPQTIDFVQVKNSDTEAFQLFRGGIGAGHCALDLALHGTQRINKVRCR